MSVLIGRTSSFFSNIFLPAVKAKPCKAHTNAVIAANLLTTQSTAPRTFPPSLGGCQFCERALAIAILTTNHANVDTAPPKMRFDATPRTLQQVTHGALDETPEIGSRDHVLFFDEFIRRGAGAIAAVAYARVESLLDDNGLERRAGYGVEGGDALARGQGAAAAARAGQRPAL